MIKTTANVAMAATTSIEKINWGGRYAFSLFICLMLVSVFVRGQQLSCGTVCTPEMAAHIQIPTTTLPFSQRSLVEIPIKIHVVCSGSNASSCYNEAAINNALTFLNDTYVDVPMQFYECGARDFIYNSPYYNFTYNTANEALLTSDHDVRNVINIYFVNTISGSQGAAAYTYLPTFGNVDRVFISTDNIAHTEHLLAHEIGHYFGLFHTHGNGTPSSTDELVNGDNCLTAGDKVCDTPADPAKSQNINYTATACVYPFSTSESPISCDNFCDDNDQIYTPLGNNLMFYAYCNLGSFNTFTQGQRDRIWNGYTTYRTYLNDAGDLVLRDGVSDVGQEPNNQVGDILGWNDMWQSPDIWNRTSQPTNLALNASERIHQDPEYKIIPAPNTGSPLYPESVYNYLCAAVTNRGCSSTPASSTIKLYWTRARSGELWPSHWYLSTSNILTDDTPYWGCDANILSGSVTMAGGAEVTTLRPFNPNYSPSGVSGAAVNPFDVYQSISIPIPALNPGQTHYVAQKWLVPDPHCYNIISSDQNVSTEWPMICFLARLEGPTEPMHNEVDNVVVTDNIKSNNNIVTRNSAFVDLLPGGISSGKVVKLLLENIATYPTNVTLNLRDFTKANLAPFLSYGGSITLILSPELWAKWVAGGSKGDGIQVAQERYLTVTDPNIANLRGIYLLSGEKYDVGVRFALNGSGKAPLKLTEAKTFDFMLWHQTEANETEPMGGGMFKVTIHPTTELGLSTNTPMSVLPNPTIGMATLNYLIDQPDYVSLLVTDINGRLVKTIISNQYHEIGVHQTSFDGTNLPKGIYFCTLTTPTQHYTTKIMLVQ